MMPEILLAGSAPWELGFMAAMASPTSNPAQVDPDYTQIGTLLDTPGPPEWRKSPQTPADSAWGHFYWVPIGGSPAPQANTMRFEVIGVSGAVIAQINSNIWQDSLRSVVHGNSTVTGPTSRNVFLPGSPCFIDFNVEVTPTGYVSRFYKNGVLLDTTSAAKTSPEKIATIRLSPSRDTVAHTSRDVAISEVLITADIPTVGVRLAQLIPNGAGHYADMPGGYADIIGDSDVGIVGTADGQRFSWEPTVYAGPGSPSTISAVVVNTTAARWTGTPDTFNSFLRIGGTDYDGAGVQPSIRDRHQTVWWENPATGLPWSPSDLANLEVGFRVTD